MISTSVSMAVPPKYQPRGAQDHCTTPDGTVPGEPRQARQRSGEQSPTCSHMSTCDSLPGADSSLPGAVWVRPGHWTYLRIALITKQ